MKDRFTQYRSKVAYVVFCCLPGVSRAVGLGAVTAAMIASAACSPSREADMRGVEAAERAVRASGPPAQERRAAALVGGRAVTWDDLRPGLAEAAGGLVLQEVAINRLLEAEMGRQGLTIGAAEVARERELLVAAIVLEARASPDDAERLLATVRRSRGLGEHRFARLLERNARLRALVAPEIQVERDEIDSEYLIRHGPRFRARVIMTATQREAMAIRQRLAASEDPLVVRFAEAAAMESIDPSAERGGIVDPISPADPSYPASIRRTLEELTPGELSAVVAVDHGFALLLLEEALPGDDMELAAVEAQIRDDVLRRAERVAMDSLARRLLREAEIGVMDRNLDWSWRGIRGER